MIQVGPPARWRALTIRREDGAHVLRAVPVFYSVPDADVDVPDVWRSYGQRIYRLVLGLDAAMAEKLAEAVVDQVVAGELPLDPDCRSAWHMVIDALASGCRVSAEVKH